MQIKTIWDTIHLPTSLPPCLPTTKIKKYGIPKCRWGRGAAASFRYGWQESKLESSDEVEDKHVLQRSHAPSTCSYEWTICACSPGFMWRIFTDKKNAHRTTFLITKRKKQFKYPSIIEGINELWYNIMEFTTIKNKGTTATCNNMGKKSHIMC